MNKELLKKTFREWKKAAKADYAITYPDSLGDCMSCVNWELAEKYGEESKGIFLKHWKYGMNGGDNVEKLTSVYIAHDLTEEQAETIYQVFGEHYNILPEKYDPTKCFELFEKETPVYEITFRVDGNTSNKRVAGDFETAKKEADYIHNRAMDMWGKPAEIVGVNKMFI